MKKLYALILVLIMCMPLSLSAAPPYPASFSWLLTYNQRDQKIANGPCNYFASVAAMEAWYQMLYGTTRDMSEQHLYSPCVTAGGGPTMMGTCLKFLQDSGVVNESDIPYPNGYTDSHPTIDYFADHIHSLSYPLYTCFAPYKAAATPNSRPDDIYFTGGYQLLSFGSLYTTMTDKVDKLKRIILNYGPLTLNLSSTVAGFHSGTPHAYLLFGWSTDVNTGQTVWQFKDSWPGTIAATTYKGDFITATTNGTFSINSGPYALVPSKNAGGAIINDAVYRKNYSSGWTKTTITKIPIDPANLNGSNLGISINGQAPGTANQYISGTQATLAIDNISQFDSYTVQWSYSTEPLWPGTSVTYTAATSANTNIYNSGADGYVTIKALITLSNGIQLQLSRRVFTNAGIPFKLVKTQDMCFSGVRTIKFEIQSKSGDPLPSSIVITTPWSLTPSTGTTAYQYYSNGLLPNSILLIDFYPPTGSYGSYGLQVTLHDPGYNNIMDMSTTGGSVAPCTTHRPASGPTISLSPNPASKQLNIAMPAKTIETYNMTLTDMSGHVLLRKRITGNTSIDVSHYAKGNYILQFISSNKKQPPVTQKVVVN